MVMTILIEGRGIMFHYTTENHWLSEKAASWLVALVPTWSDNLNLDITWYDNLNLGQMIHGQLTNGKSPKGDSPEATHQNMFY